MRNVKLWDWVGWNQRFKWKSIEYFMSFFLCMYKMVDISAETWNKAWASVIRVHENGNVNKAFLKLLCVSDVKKRWGCKNLYDLVDKEIKGNYEVKNMNELTMQ